MQHQNLTAQIAKKGNSSNTNRLAVFSEYISLSAKMCPNGGVGFLTVKICFKHCLVVALCVFITGQYHSRNNMSSKSGAAGEIFFESEKRHGI